MGIFFVLFCSLSSDWGWEMVVGQCRVGESLLEGVVG